MIGKEINMLNYDTEEDTLRGEDKNILSHSDYNSIDKIFERRIRKYSTPGDNSLITNSFFLTNNININLNENLADIKEKKVLIFYTSGFFCMTLDEKNSFSYEKNFLFYYMCNHVNLCDKRFTKENLNSKLEPSGYLSTPKTLYGKRIFYRILELENIIDSINMTLDLWKKIGRILRDNYDDYDAFIVIHWIDTLVYTASILSFMFGNLNKPIIVTGSHIPISEMRTDAHTNLVDALILTGFFNIPEVSVLFGSELFRANRTIKIDNVNFTAYESPNFQPLAKLGVDIRVNWEIIMKESGEPICYFDDLSNNMSIVKIFPMISDEHFMTFFNSPIEAVIIETYGAGNIPINRPKIIETIREASQRGVIILNVSQCRKGVASTSYETGKLLESLGVVFAGDITLECAMAKLSYLLGKKFERKTICELLKTNLRGELTPHKKEDFSHQSNTYINNFLNTLGIINEENECKFLIDSLLPSIINQLIQQQNLEILKKIKNEISCLSFVEFSDKSPLHTAAKVGDELIMKFLMNFENLKINLLDNKKMTALNYACLYKKEKVARIIKNSGGVLNLDSCLNLGHHFCKLAFEGDINRLKLFYECGANIMAGNFQKRTAAHIAAAEGKIEIINFLIINAKYDIIVQDKIGNTPLDYSEQMKNYIENMYKNLKNRIILFKRLI